MKPFQPPPPRQPPPPTGGTGASGSSGNGRAIGVFIAGFVAFVLFVSSINAGADSDPILTSSEVDYMAEEIEYAVEDSYFPVAMDSAAIELELGFMLECETPAQVNSFPHPGSFDDPIYDPEAFAIGRESSEFFVYYIDSFDGVDMFAVYLDAEARPIHAMVMRPSLEGWWVSQMATCPRSASVVTPYIPPSATPPSTTTTTTTSAPPTTTTTTSIPRGRPVPGVAELPLDDAIIELFDWNLEISRTSEPSADIPKGIVIRTEPAAGTIVAPKSVVTIVVSSGEE